MFCPFCSVFIVHLSMCENQSTLDSNRCESLHTLRSATDVQMHCAWLSSSAQCEWNNQFSFHHSQTPSENQILSFHAFCRPCVLLFCHSVLPCQIAKVKPNLRTAGAQLVSSFHTYKTPAMRLSIVIHCQRLSSVEPGWG